jgi:hypothetical protein
MPEHPLVRDTTEEAGHIGALGQPQKCVPLGGRAEESSFVRLAICPGVAHCRERKTPPPGDKGEKTIVSSLAR